MKKVHFRLFGWALGVVVMLALVLKVATVPTPTVAKNHQSNQTALSNSTDNAAQKHLAATKSAMGKLPLAFEPNRGQTDSRVKFLARSSGYAVFVTGPASTVMEFVSLKQKKVDVLSMNLAGANPSATVAPEEQTGGVSNYYIGNDRSKWIEGVTNYAKVRARNAYPGIDVVYQGNQRNLRYDFVVSPGADPKAIRLAFDGTKNITLNEDGNLVLALSGGTLISSKPYIYQEVNGLQQTVEGGYRVDRNKQVTFEIARYDATRPLIIDPNASIGTYLGGSLNDSINDVSVDSSGVYVSGNTFSPTFPSAGSSPQLGLQHAFVTKLSLILNSVAYSTYIGGNGTDNSTAIAISGGKAYVVGQTASTNFPSTANIGPASTTPTNGHGYILNLTTAGTINFATLLGGSLGSDSINAVAVDGGGQIHIAGQTASTDFPVFPAATAAVPAYQTAFTGSSAAFYAALNPTGTALVYSTFLASSTASSQTTAKAIAVDSSNNAYVTGQTTANTFPVICNVTPGCGNGGIPTVAAPHAFVAKINPAGPAITAATRNTAIVYAEYLGLGANLSTAAGSSESGNAIAVDVFGNVYVAGQTSSTTTAAIAFAFPNTVAFATRGGLTAGNATDGFVAKLNASGAPVYLLAVNGAADGVSGGAGTASVVNGIAVDALGQAYIAGTTVESSNLALIRRRVTISPTTTAPFTVFPTQSGVFPNGDLTSGLGTVTGLAGNAAAYDPSSRTSCSAGAALSDASLNGLAVSGNSGGFDGYIVCAQFNADTAVSPTSLTFNVPIASTNATIATQNINLNNPALVGITLGAVTATSPVTATAACPFTSWLTATASPTGDTITATVANVACFDPGTYTGTINVPVIGGVADNSGSTIVIPVTLNITGGQLLVNGSTGGGVPTATSFQKTNASDTNFTDGKATETLFIPVLTNGIGAAVDMAKFNLVLTNSSAPTNSNPPNAVVPDAAPSSFVIATDATKAPVGGVACNTIGTAIASPAVCYIQVTIASAQFLPYAPGTYTAGLQFQAFGPTAQGGTVVPPASNGNPAGTVPNINLPFTVVIGGTAGKITISTAPSGAGMRFDFSTGSTAAGGSEGAAIVTINNGNGPAGVAAITTPLANFGLTPANTVIPTAVEDIPTSVPLPAAANATFTYNIINPSALAPGVYGSAIKATVTGGSNVTSNNIPLFIGPVIIDQFATAPNGVNATGNAVLGPTSGTSVTGFTGTFPTGTLYANPPTVNIGAPPVGGTQATATATLTTAGLTPVGTAITTLITAGSGYQTPPAATITAALGGTCTVGAGGAATVQLAPTGVNSVVVNPTGGTNAGAGTGYTATPTVAIGVPGCTINGTTCIQATATAVLTDTVTGVTGFPAGSGCTSQPTVTFPTPAGGTPATGRVTLTGTTLANGTYTAGIAGGSGYTLAPAVTVTPSAAPGCSGGSVALTTTVTSTLSPTTVAGLNLTAGGAGCVAPTVSFSGGCATQPTASVTVTGTTVTSITLLTPGSGCTSPPTVIINDGGSACQTGGATPAIATATLTGTSVASITIAGGAGSTGFTCEPTVAIAPPASGTTATFSTATTPIITPTTVAGVTILTGGVGYPSAPTLTGASFVGGCTTEPTGLTVTVTGSITAYTMNANGAGYTSIPTVTVTPIGGGPGSGAAASAILGSSSTAGTGIASITLTGGGSYNCNPGVFFNNTGTGGTGAAFGGGLLSTSIASVALTSGGSGYTSAPAVSFSAGNGVAPTANLTLSSPLTGITITNVGSGYTANPVITIDALNTACTTKPVATITQSNGSVVPSTVSITTPGACATPPTITFGAPAVVAFQPVGNASWPVVTTAITTGAGVGPTTVTIQPSGNGLLANTNLTGTTALNTVGGGAGTPTTTTICASVSGGVCIGSAPSWITFGANNLQTIACTLTGGTNANPLSTCVGGNPTVVVNPPSTVATGTYTATILTTATDITGTAAVGFVSYPITLTVNVSNGPVLVVTAGTSTGTQIGGVESVQIVNGGTGYTTAPTVTFTSPTSGVTATGTATISTTTGAVTGVTVTTATAGSGYTTAPIVSFSGGGGTGAVAIAYIGSLFNTVQNSGTVTNSQQNFSVNYNGANPSSVQLVPTFVSSDGNFWAQVAWVPTNGSNNTLAKNADAVTNPKCNSLSPNYLDGTTSTGAAAPLNGSLAPANGGACQVSFTTTNGVQTLVVVPQTALIATLQPGTYTGTVTLTPYASYTSSTVNTLVNPPAAVSFPVTLTITTLPAITTSPAFTEADFTFTNGAPATNPTTLTAQLGLSGAASSIPAAGIPFTATPTSTGSWLKIALNGGTAGTTALSGSLTGTASANSLAITVNTAGLNLATIPAQLTGNIAVTTATNTTSNTTLNIPVVVTLFPTPTVTLTPTATSFSLTAGQAPTPATQTVSLTLSGPDTYTVATAVTSTGANWLSATFGSGGVTSSNNTNSVVISAIQANAPTAAGTYTGTVTVTGNAGEKSTVNVTLTVAAAPTLSLSPIAAQTVAFSTTPATFTVTTNAALSSAPLNPATLPATCTSSAAFVTPASTTISLVGTTAAPITYTINPAGLAASATPYTSTISCTTTSGITPAIAASTTVSLTVTQPAITAVCTPTTSAQCVNGGLVFNLPTASTTAVTGSITVGATIPVPFSAVPAVTSGAWTLINLTATGGTTPGTAIVTVNPTGLAAGIYTGSVAISGTNATGSFNIPVTVNIGQCTLALSANSASLTVNGTSTGGFYPSTTQSFTVTPTNCPGTATLASLTATAASGQAWLTVQSVNTTTGAVNFQAFSNANSTARSAAITLNATGVASPASYTVNEAASTAPSPNRQVQVLYQQLLGREPDQTGFTFWIGQGTAQLGFMADSFLTSLEGQNNNFQPFQIYGALLNRQPTFAEMTSALALIRPPASYTAGATTSVANILAGSEYVSKYGAYNPSTYVTNVYLNLLGRVPTPTELNAALAGLTAGTITNYQIIANLIVGAEYQNTGTFRTAADHSNVDYINACYVLILGRDPDASGNTFWIGIANGGGSGIFYNGSASGPTRIQILGTGVANQGFIGSAEFQNLFK